MVQCLCKIVIKKKKSIKWLLRLNGCNQSMLSFICKSISLNTTGHLVKTTVSFYRWLLNGYFPGKVKILSFPFAFPPPPIYILFRFIFLIPFLDDKPSNCPLSRRWSEESSYVISATSKCYPIFIEKIISRDYYLDHSGKLKRELFAHSPFHTEKFMIFGPDFSASDFSWKTFYFPFLYLPHLKKLLVVFFKIKSQIKKI